MRYLFFIVLTLSLWSCKETSTDSQASLTPIVFDKEAVRSEMQKLVYAYGSAVEQMDADKTIACFSDDPEFYVYSDGDHYNIDDMKAAVKTGFFKGLKKIEITWDTLNIRVLSQTEAVCLMRLTETLTDSNDQKTRVAVEATFVGTSKNNEWRIAYGHASHKILLDK